MLLCATEMNKRQDMDTVAAAFGGTEPERKRPRLVSELGMIKKVSKHIVQNEPLVFELSSPGKRGYQLPDLDVPRSIPTEALGKENVRAEIEDFPEISEFEVLRHFTRLSTWNYAIDLGMYPLGSCTMKYNPRVNELVARTEGLAWAHPYQPDALSQGCMEVIAALETALAEITGMDAVTLQPAAGAHGEFTGILMMRALLENRGGARKKILVPDSAHGTNPATAMMVGYRVENIKSNDRGMVDLEVLSNATTEDVAGLMITNPNTVGVFEENIHKICDIMHDKGALVYMDGANMNASGWGCASGRFRRGRDAPQSAQDILDSTWRRRSRIGRGCRGEGAHAVLAQSTSEARRR